MAKVKPGDLFEVNWPFTDQAGAKRRPAVALGAEDSHYDVELLMVTTQKQHGDCVALADSDYAALPLPKPSFVRITRPLKVRMDRITPLGLQLTIECVARLRRGIILRDTRSFSSLAHRANRPADDPLRAPFVPGKTTVRYAGRVFDTNEVEAAISSTLDFWLMAGRYADEFEAGLAEFLGMENVLLVNSGSSANLVAFSTLTSPKLKDRRVKPGDEVITLAAGFPTTVAPIIQNRAVPVFVDVELGTYVPNFDKIEAALSSKTKAVMIAHTMGVPYAVREVREFCDRHGLWLVEDNCDALGARYEGRLTATFGDLATFSFYPAHHITMGEGGAVAVANEDLARIARSFRDWGRDCYCAGGENNTCGKRFAQQFGTLPLRLRPQIRLLAHRLQPQGDRHAGRHRGGATGQARPVRGGAEAQPCRAGSRVEEARAALDPAHGAIEVGPVLVRLRHHRAPRVALHASRAGQRAGDGAHRDAEPFLRKPAPPPGLRGD
jgi:CDP-6-deoxy-D-xylo-4-hexulose-3-dehydrase